MTRHALICAVFLLTMRVTPVLARIEIGEVAVPARDGHQLYAQSCAACHGLQAEGTRQGPPLRGVGAAALDFMLATGRMPLADPTQQPTRHLPKFTPPEIGAIISYVTALGPGGPPIPSINLQAGNLARGRAVFAANCLPCHASGAQGAAIGGGWIAPSLREATVTQIAEAVRIGPGAMPRFGPQVLTDRDLNALVRYVLFLREAKDPGGFNLGYLGPVAEGFVTVVVGLGTLILIVLIMGARE